MFENTLFFMSLSYKGYRIGTIEKGILQLLLGVKDTELPKRGCGSTFSNIFSTARQKREFPEIIRRLKEKDLITFAQDNGTIRANLTEKGKRVTEIILFENKKNSARMEKWDGIWRVVIFDIPQEKQRSRDMLRGHLKNFGFKQIQGSVWAYPFPCEDIVTLIKTYFKLGSEVLYLTVTSLEGDSKLKKSFGL